MKNIITTNFINWFFQKWYWILTHYPFKKCEYNILNIYKLDYCFSSGNIWYDTEFIRVSMGYVFSVGLLLGFWFSLGLLKVFSWVNEVFYWVIVFWRVSKKSITPKGMNDCKQLSQKKKFSCYNTSFLRTYKFYCGFQNTFLVG